MNDNLSSFIELMIIILLYIIIMGAGVILMHKTSFTSPTLMSVIGGILFCFAPASIIVILILLPFV